MVGDPLEKIFCTDFVSRILNFQELEREDLIAVSQVSNVFVYSTIRNPLTRLCTLSMFEFDFYRFVVSGGRSYTALRGSIWLTG